MIGDASLKLVDRVAEGVDSSAVAGLVERFDIEPFSDFSAK